MATSCFLGQIPFQQRHKNSLQHLHDDRFSCRYISFHRDGLSVIRKFMDIPVECQINSLQTALVRLKIDHSFLPRC